MKKKELVALSSLLVIIVAIVAYVVIKNQFAPADTWEVASEVSGTGSRETTEFNMTSQWRLAWKVENGVSNYFIAQVYVRNSSDSNGFSLIAESDESDTNSATGGCSVDFTGSFIIRVVTEDSTSWSLQIQEPVKPTRAYEAEGNRFYFTIVFSQIGVNCAPESSTSHLARYPVTSWAGEQNLSMPALSEADYGFPMT